MIAPVDQSDATLDRAVRLIVERCRPLRVLLFGSRARGDARADSDYDIMVEVEQPAAGLEKALRRALFDAGASADVIVRSAARFEDDRGDVGTLVYAAEHDGRLLYGPPLAPRRVRESPRVPRSVSAWLRRADNDFRALEQSVASSDPPWDTVCSHAHQGIEKTLKAVLITTSTPPPRSHDLRALLQLCPHPFRDDASLQRACTVLDELSPRSRYPDAAEPSESEGREAVGLARGARSILQQAISRTGLLELPRPDD